MRAQRTPLVHFLFPIAPPDRLEAVLRVIGAVKSERNKHWERSRTLEHGLRLTDAERLHHQHYPLVAAMLDKEVKHRRWHVPVQVNGEYVCVIWEKSSANRYHVMARRSSNFFG